MEILETATLGEGWLDDSRRILEAGVDAAYDGQATKELSLLSLRVARPDPEDRLIASLADPAWLDWMRRNFTAHIRSTSARRPTGTWSSSRGSSTRSPPRWTRPSARWSSMPSRRTSTSRSSRRCGA